MVLDVAGAIAESPDMHVKRFRLRFIRGNIMMSTPLPLMKKESAKRGLTTKEFSERYDAIAHWADDYTVVYYTFQPIDPEK